MQKAQYKPHSSSVAALLVGYMGKPLTDCFTSQTHDRDGKLCGWILYAAYDYSCLVSWSLVQGPVISNFHCVNLVSEGQTSHWAPFPCVGRCKPNLTDDTSDQVLGLLGGHSMRFPNSYISLCLRDILWVGVPSHHMTCSEWLSLIVQLCPGRIGFSFWTRKCTQ